MKRAQDHDGHKRKKKSQTRTAQCAGATYLQPQPDTEGVREVAEASVEPKAANRQRMPRFSIQQLLEAQGTAVREEYL